MKAASEYILTVRCLEPHCQWCEEGLAATAAAVKHGNTSGHGDFASHRRRRLSLKPAKEKL